MFYTGAILDLVRGDNEVVTRRQRGDERGGQGGFTYQKPLYTDLYWIYSGFELNEKKKEKENSMVFRADSREIFSLFLEGIFK
ncbi:MAG: hypothetical protein L6408_00720 [Nanoarchaeota archaeon]|nr:hypothetical protein [Nanoarchaeota archaeon]